MAEFLRSCKYGQTLLKEFQTNTIHLIDSVHIYSLFDLKKMSEGTLLESFLRALKSWKKHIMGDCEVSNSLFLGVTQLFRYVEEKDIFVKSVDQNQSYLHFN